MVRSSAAVVYAILAAGVLLLLLTLSLHPPSPSHHSHHRRLKLRPHAAPQAPDPHHRVPFDPVIADIESRREDREWEREHYPIPDPAPGYEAQPEWEDFMDAEDYINDEEQFNVTGRIVLLFPKIDVDPADGVVTAEELTEWTLKQADREVMRRTQRDMDLHDKNHDGLVSFQEYQPPGWAKGSGDSDGIGWWSEVHFNASDRDGDGLLNITEFKDFLHPPDSTNPKLIQWLCKEEIRGRDSDKDGKLNFQEFFHGLFDAIKNYDDLSNHSDSEVPAKKLFQQLDLDSNGFLSDDELRPVITSIHPSERYYAKQQAEYMISQADADKDGRLSLREMIDHPYAFYSAIFSDDEDYAYHDEFR